ncbi:ferredoxin domain-containing protein [Methanocella arvoryzae]|uniref:DUF2148 domain-containing protein n=1 Tax=Methanocella arvoryzae (strain DSM 22066 / NBRC 105507 / MRE50) TaxID=351160 RepID=Q0W3W7_METAR|nr:DUF2148 domain-containing protein [Methanocella arvoryzae]CAJ36926.1 conserved hypothetical protein [Methanocella arvoryzae MRE50]
MITKGEEMEQRGVEQVAALMCTAARTAPKGRGIDNLTTLVVTGSDLQKLSAEMRRISEECEAPFFARDAANVDASRAVVLLGQRLAPFNLPACGYCGFKDCKEAVAANAACAISAGDLGIASLSAAAVAARHHVDNRIMFTVGRAALNLGLFGDDRITMAYGIPLSVSGKSPYFDRK